MSSVPGRAGLGLIALLSFTACQRDRTDHEELARATARPPVPIGQGQSANLRAGGAGTVAGAGSPNAPGTPSASGGFGATSNQLGTGSGGAPSAPAP